MADVKVGDKIRLVEPVDGTWPPNNTPKPDTQDSLTFSTAHGKVVSVAWGQGTKETPKVSLSVQGTAVSLTQDELDALLLTLVHAKEQNEEIFKE